MKPTPLSIIVSNAYTIFNYPRPMEITNVCTECCISPENARKLLTLPLNEIPVELIKEYNDGAQATNYDMDEFKYFLPRYLDLLQQFQFPSCIDNCLSLKNLNFQNENHWKNKDEKEIIEQFSIAFMIEYLNDGLVSCNESIAGILNMFYKAQIPIAPLLDLIKDNLNDIGVSYIASLLLEDVNFRGTRIIDSFVDDELSAIILNWVRDNKSIFYEYIEDYIMNKSNDNKSQELSYLYDFLKFF